MLCKGAAVGTLVALTASVLVWSKEIAKMRAMRQQLHARFEFILVRILCCICG